MEPPTWLRPCLGGLGNFQSKFLLMNLASRRDFFFLNHCVVFFMAVQVISMVNTCSTPLSLSSNNASIRICLLIKLTPRNESQWQLQLQVHGLPSPLRSLRNTYHYLLRDHQSLSLFPLISIFFFSFLPFSSSLPFLFLLFLPSY